MNKEKLASLIKYRDGINAKLTSPVPEKHKDHPKTYQEFLERELKSVSRTIENLILAGAGDKK